MDERLFEFWSKKVKDVPDATIREWLEERFPGLYDLNLLTDCNRLGFYSWVYQDMCGRLDLDAPEDWFIWKVWMFHEGVA